MSDIVVIGATAAGMATALRLAVKHHQITVVDAQPRAGGLLLGHARDGLAFDTGALTLPAVFRDLFLKTGGALEDEVDLQSVDSAREHHFADGTSVRLPGAGVGLAAHAIGDALGERAREQWAAFMSAAADEWTAGRQEAWHAKSTDAIIAGTSSAPALITRGSSMDAAIHRHLRDPRLRAIAGDYAMSLGVDPGRVPTALITRPYVEQAFGIWHVGGGRRRLADALVRRATMRGVTFRLGAGVAATHTSTDGRHHIGLTDGSSVEADVIVQADTSASLYAQSFTDDPAVVPPHRTRWRQTRPKGRLTVFAAVDSIHPAAHLTTWHGSGSIPTITVCAPDDPAMRAHADSTVYPWTITATASTQCADDLLDALATHGTDIRPHVQWMDVRR